MSIGTIVACTPRGRPHIEPMSTSYRHVQIGWVILGSLVPVALLSGFLTLGSHGQQIFGTVTVTMLVVALLFGALTVEVGGGQIVARFGIGLVKKRVPLADVRAAAVVTNPWYYGWGLRLIPGGTLYNVSGSRAVELVLSDGSVWRVGSDEPGALLAAVLAETGPLSATPPEELAARQARGQRAWLILVALVAALFVGIGALMVAEGRPPRARVEGGVLTVEATTSHANVPLSEVRDVTLATELPRILARTNGYAFGETLRGWFRVEGLGEGRLYVQAKHPPFVIVRLDRGFVIVGLADEARTRALYDSLRAALPPRAP